MDAYIRSKGLALKTEDIVGVSQEQWTVKPARTKHLVPPEDKGSTSSYECSGGDDDVITSEGTEFTGTASSVIPGYICRPSHRQLPHTGIIIRTYMYM